MVKKSPSDGGLAIDVYEELLAYFFDLGDPFDGARSVHSPRKLFQLREDINVDNAFLISTH
jgi:hypothetical protein